MFPAVFSSCCHTFVRAFKSAPFETSNRATSACCCAAAHIKAVCPRSNSARFTSAPRSISNLTDPWSPERAALINGVSPIFSVAFGFASASRSNSSILPLPFVAASQSGVAPRAFDALASAPAFNKAVAVSRSFRCAAQWRAVAPSPSVAFTSTRLDSSVLTWSPSPFFMASMSSEGFVSWAAAPIMLTALVATEMMNRRTDCLQIPCAITA